MSNCAATTLVDGERTGCPNAGTPVWCPGHRQRILDALTEIPHWVEWLEEEAVAGRTASEGEKLGKTPKKPAAPSPSASIDVLEAIAQWCHEWTVVVASNLRHVGPTIDTPAGTPHLGGALDKGLAYLLAQADFWLDNDDLVDLGYEAVQWRGRVVRFCRRDDPINRLHAPCPHCEREEVLFRRNGAGFVECRNCELVWPEEHYERMVKVLTS